MMTEDVHYVKPLISQSKSSYKNFDVPRLVDFMRKSMSCKPDPVKIHDIYDGAVFSDIKQRPHLAGAEFLVLLLLHHDAVEVTRYPKASVTPVLASVLNFPIWLRFKMTSLFCLAILPKNERNCASLLEPVGCEAM